MIMLRITNTCWVTADQIAGVAVHEADETIAVHLKNGGILDCDLGFDDAMIFAEQLVDKINHALSAMLGARHD